MTPSGRHAPSVLRGLRFLHESQLPYGEFRTYASPSPDMRRTFFDSSVFVTAFVLHGIARIEHPWATRMREKAVSFLAGEMHDTGLFRYFSSKNPRSIGFDLDDTACASVALQQWGPGIAVCHNVEHFVGNRDADGLFYTWVGNATPENEVDSVVNANVVFYLGERGETRSACRHLVETIRSGREAGSYRYYLDDVTLYYAVSRAYAHNAPSLGAAREAAAEGILRRAEGDGSFGDELTTAQALCGLANFGYDDPARLEEAARYLERRQGPDGSWRRAPLFRGAGMYFGSEELTTALCLEALVLAGR